jgi:putative thiamine transport system permease protein
VGAAIAPVLATPHSALAIGLAFVIAPSGLIVRALSPWLTGFEVPPDVATVGDARGIALMLALLLKEVPYLVLMIAGALAQVPVERQLDVARTLGYARATAWMKVILPQVYAQVRLPVFAVLAFSLSVVDVALIVGPSHPPTLAVLAVRGFADPDVSRYFPAAAASMLLLLMVILAIAAWMLVERPARALGRAWLARGNRDGAPPALAMAGAGATGLLLALCAAAVLAMGLWSVTSQWRFPDALPSAWDFGNWSRRIGALATPAWTTLVVGVTATAVALVLAVACLEHESRTRRVAGRRALWLLYLPLLVPQVAFLFGAQVLLVRLGLDGTLAAVVWAHLVFVLPYLFLSLADPWRALDPRYARASASLGAAPWRTLLAIKLPLLLRPILVACAVAFAVSVGLYLPTVFAGSGLVATLTTEAVTLASGSDRRVIGAYATLQAVLPMAAFAVAAMSFGRRSP